MIENRRGEKEVSAAGFMLASAFDDDELLKSHTLSLVPVLLSLTCVCAYPLGSSIWLV